MKRRHITLSRVDLPTGWSVLWVSEQTHRCDGLLGPSLEWRAPNGVRIQSKYYPHLLDAHSPHPTLCVLGDVRIQDHIPITAETQIAERVCAAVHEFNLAHAGNSKPNATETTLPIRVCE